MVPQANLSARSCTTAASSTSQRGWMRGLRRMTSTRRTRNRSSTGARRRASTARSAMTLTCTGTSTAKWPSCQIPAVLSPIKGFRVRRGAAKLLAGRRLCSLRDKVSCNSMYLPTKKTVSTVQFPLEVYQCLSAFGATCVT
jgi:hypothetical protein